MTPPNPVEPTNVGATVSAEGGVTLREAAEEALSLLDYLDPKHGITQQLRAALAAQPASAQADGDAELLDEALNCLRAVANEGAGGHWQWAKAIVEQWPHAPVAAYREPVACWINPDALPELRKQKGTASANVWNMKVGPATMPLYTTALAARYAATEELCAAFLSQHGCLPDEAEIVQQFTDSDRMNCRVFVRKRDKRRVE